ncbi:MAG: 16S rRNA (cytidine(1402)-2'-O)-methyltransferase [Tissierellia bacterium]|nr:16S rRNA (cytidine(1402)-2'-O)-methyltransferase [Tissierellia bacterium]
MLYLLATPLGNLGDINLRTIETLSRVDIIYAEDTRRTRILLNHLAISRPLKRYDENRPVEGSALASSLIEGLDIAFVSDAGMPLISDPGYELVQFCLNNNLAFEAQPGATAFSLALINSGLASHSFVFAGFLPRKKKERKEKLAHFRDYEETLIFYEAPHRIKETLADSLKILGNRRACLSREMTKIYEEHLRMELKELLEEITANPRKGEMVLTIEGAGPKENAVIDLDELIKNELESGSKTKEIATKISKTLGITSSEAYKLVLERKEE